MNEKEKQERVRKGFFFSGIGKRNVALFMSLIDVFVLFVFVFYGPVQVLVWTDTHNASTHSHAPTSIDPLPPSAKSIE